MGLSADYSNYFLTYWPSIAPKTAPPTKDPTSSKFPPHPTTSKMNEIDDDSHTRDERSSMGLKRGNSFTHHKKSGGPVKIHAESFQ